MHAEVFREVVDGRYESQAAMNRVTTLSQLGRALFEARHDVTSMLEELVTALTVSLCDGCSIVIAPGSIAIGPLMGHRTEPGEVALAALATAGDPGIYAFKSTEDARTTLAPGYGTYIARFGMRSMAILPLDGNLLKGTVTVTRDTGSAPFDDADLAAIAACIGYTSLAAENMLELDAERQALRTERERMANFHRDMLGIVGHDLRAPLGAIIMGTEILATSDASALNLARIVSFAKRMTRMVDQILDMTRARLGGGIPLARSKTRLSPLIESAMRDLASTRLELVANTEIRGVWDPDRLAQAVTSLLTNALQYGREGGPVRVDVSQSDASATISVHNELRDQPITQAALATLFEPYQRGNDEDHIGTGLGLGLYIVREIVRAHGGRVSAESSPSGTTVQMVLPATAVA